MAEVRAFSSDDPGYQLVLKAWIEFARTPTMTGVKGFPDPTFKLILVFSGGIGAYNFFRDPSELGLIVAVNAALMDLIEPE